MKGEEYTKYPTPGMAMAAGRQNYKSELLAAGIRLRLKKEAVPWWRFRRRRQVKKWLSSCSAFIEDVLQIGTPAFQQAMLDGLFSGVSIIKWRTGGRRNQYRVQEDDQGGGNNAEQKGSI